MVTDRRETTVVTAEGLVIACGYCPRKVVFHPTVMGGHALCFDATTMPRRHDRKATGWIPVPTPATAGDTHYAPYLFAPVAGLPYRMRSQSAQVWQLHACSGQSRAVAA